MLQQFVDNVLAVTKESVKTFTNESLNNIARLINGISALLLAFLPGKTPILEGMHGWELRPTFRGPRFPRWMENGVSSFNQFIHDLSLEFDSPEEDYTSAEENEDEGIFPSSPLSQSSRLSHASSFSRYDRSRSRKIRRMLSFLLWAIKFFFFFPLFILRSITFGRREAVRCSDITAETKSSSKYQVFDRATDRRRGVVEDLQLGIEIIIESVFHFFHKAAHFLLSPREACVNMWRWWTVHEDRDGEVRADVDTTVQASILADDDPTLTERHTRFHQSLNTDARTCEDVIREYGYPYESFKVVTDDGYILLLERIPRRDSQKVVYLQHGILDSSMGWVSNGVVGSPAFAAFDQGYDVFLGNFRGLVSREHVDNNISSHKYWNYSVNEHGTEDIPAIISKIHQVKISELNGQSQPLTLTDQPYKLCAVSHSLGGAAMIMYVITQRTSGRAHRLTRLILLSPAGFHGDSALVITFVEHFLLLLGPLLAYIIPALYIPTRFFRLLINKLARDFHNYPALGGLVQTLMSYVAGGDSSNWLGALGLPHYNVYDMPGLSLHVGIHLAQMKRRGKFMMYDYGSAAANVAVYGSSDPPDLGELYPLIDVPVDLVAGRKDQVIRASMVRKHYKMMKRAGVEVTLNEFEYAHLDFTFSHREELLRYVMSRLMLVAPPGKVSQVSSVRNRKAGRNEERSEGIVEDGVDEIGR